MPTPLTQVSTQSLLATKGQETIMVLQHNLRSPAYTVRALVTRGYQPLKAHHQQIRRTCVQQQSRSLLPMLRHHQDSVICSQQRNRDPMLVTIVAINRLLLLLGRRMFQFQIMMACHHHLFQIVVARDSGVTSLDICGRTKENVVLSVELVN